VRSTGGGLTTLPANEEFLADRIQDSLRAFNPRVSKPGGEYYLFVLEDTATRQIVGTGGISARVGGFDPCTAIRFAGSGSCILRSRSKKKSPCCICWSSTGPLGGLLAFPARRLPPGRRRPPPVPRAISFHRRLSSPLHGDRHRRNARLYRSLRQIPFLGGGRPAFLRSRFYAADVLSGLGEKEFIADLMPRHPLYVPLFPGEVQAVLDACIMTRNPPSPCCVPRASSRWVKLTSSMAAR